VILVKIDVALAFWIPAFAGITSLENFILKFTGFEIAGRNNVFKITGAILRSLC